MSFFHQRPQTRRQPPVWLLPKVLSLLESPKYCQNPLPLEIQRKAIFLIALATGHRVSQLAALVRGNSFTRFTPGDLSVTLAPSPEFLAKNERTAHRIEPVVIDAWLQDGSHHALCPVAALRRYLDNTENTQAQYLWVQPASGRRLRSVAVARILRDVIKEGDPEATPIAHQVRSYSSSLAFFRTFDLDSVQSAGQWSSSASLVSRYLNTRLQDVPCVVMGATPS